MVTSVGRTQDTFIDLTSCIFMISGWMILTKHFTMCVSKHLWETFSLLCYFTNISNKQRIKPVSSPIVTVPMTFLQAQFSGNFLLKSWHSIHSSKRHKIGTCSRIFNSQVFYVKSIIAFQPPDISRVCKVNDLKHDSSFFDGVLLNQSSQIIYSIIRSSLSIGAEADSERVKKRPGR